jgi:membrane-bound lytic murein transglycosylase MltF
MKHLFSSAAALLAVTGALNAQAPTEKGRLGIALTDILKPWTGDLDGMVERRMIRVLTTYSKTQYFIDKGTPRGTAYDQGKLLESDLNERLKTGNLRISVQFIPLSRSELIPALLEGKGEIVMADLTVTPEREQVVDFTEPWIAGVDEIVVTGPKVPAMTTIDDLSGKEVFVRASSSYYQSLTALNERFSKEGKPPATLTPAPEALEDEDLMEMANAGLVEVLVVDNHKAWFWQRVWPQLKLYPAITLGTGGEIAWATRKAPH